MNQLPLHNVVKPLKWLEGTWITLGASGKGTLPFKNPFSYCEEIKFSSIGQPMFNYEAQSWNPESKNPMHREVGVLKVIEGTNKVKLLLAHNFGLTTIEEGEVNDKHICLETTSIGRMSEGVKDPTVMKIRREFKYNDNCLEQIVFMATSKNQELTQHIHAKYVKQEV